MQPYLPPLKQRNTHGNPTLINLRPSCTGDHGQTTGHIVHIANPSTLTRREQAGRDTAGITTEQRAAPRTAPMWYGWAVAQQQSRGQYTTYVQHA